jgi:hypothetical protein
MIDAPQLAAFLKPPRPGPDDLQSTGIAALDQVLGPLLPHDLVLIDARNEEEATALAASLASSIASSGRTVIILSLRVGAEAFQPVDDARRLEDLGGGAREARPA